jgi:hypothetical protein
MAITTGQSIGYAGVNVTFGTPAGFDLIAGADRRFVWIKNGGGVSTNVTIAVPGSTFGQNNPDVVVSIPAGEERMIGPLDPGLNEPGQGNRVVVGVSPTTSVTGAFVDLPIPPPDLP